MQCTATNRRGTQCERAAIHGGNVCYMHGGAAPQVRAAALKRIHSLVDPALEALAEALTDDAAQIRVAAAKDILDRAGYKPKDEIEHSGELSIADVLRQRKKRNGDGAGS